MLGGHILQLSIAKYLFSSWTNWNKHPHAVSFSESFNKHWIIVLHLSWRTIALNSPCRENVSTLFSVELGRVADGRLECQAEVILPHPHWEKTPHFFWTISGDFFFFPSETRTFVARMLLFLSSTQLSLFPFLLVLSFPSPILQLSGHEISEEREKDLILTESRCVPHTCSTYILSFSPWWQPSERYCFRHFFVDENAEANN